MLTKKRIVALILAIGLLTVMLFASGTKEVAKDNVKVEEKTTITVLDYMDATAPGYEETQKIWQKFMDENPNITIVKEDLTNEAFHQKMASYIAAGKIPDLMYMYPSGRSSILQENHMVKDLEVLLGDEFLKSFLPAALNVENQSGNYLAMLPQAVTYSSVVYVNTKVLRDNGLEIPTTYADMVAMGPKLKAKGIQTVLMANKDDWVMQSCLFSTVAGRFVNKEWIDKAKLGEVKFTDEEFVSALRFVDKMYKDDVLSRKTIQLSYGEVPGLFASGKAAFLIDGDWRQNAFVTDPASKEALISPLSQQEDIALISFPAIEGETYPGVVSSTSGCGYGISTEVSDGSYKESACKKLVEYLYSVEVQKQFLEIGKYITSRTDVKSDKLEPLTLKLIEFYKEVKGTCYVLDSALDPSVYTVINKVLQEIGIGSKTPEVAALEIQKAMDIYLLSKK